MWLGSAFFHVFGRICELILFTYLPFFFFFLHGLFGVASNDEETVR